MTAASVHAAIAVAFADSGVKIEGRHHGGHALRFSLAQRMLDKSTPIPVISETLGHQETDMTRSYVRIDFTHLRQCVLDVPNVSDEFYMQDLHACQRAVHEDECLAVTHVPIHLVGYDTAQGIEALAHVSRIGIQIESIRFTQTEHRC